VRGVSDRGGGRESESARAIEKEDEEEKAFICRIGNTRSDRRRRREMRGGRGEFRWRVFRG